MGAYRSKTCFHIQAVHIYMLRAYIWKRKKKVFVVCVFLRWLCRGRWCFGLVYLCDVFAGYLCGRLSLHLSSKISKSRIETEVVCVWVSLLKPGFESRCESHSHPVEDLRRDSVVNAGALRNSHSTSEWFNLALLWVQYLSAALPAQSLRDASFCFSIQVSVA